MLTNSNKTETLSRPRRCLVQSRSGLLSTWQPTSRPDSHLNGRGGAICQNGRQEVSEIVDDAPDPDSSRFGQIGMFGRNRKVSISIPRPIKATSRTEALIQKFLGEKLIFSFLVETRELKSKLVPRYLFPIE